MHTAPTVVGYTAAGTPDIGLTMLSGSFNGVGAGQTFKLADMRGAGYEEGEEAWGEVIVKVLGTDGAAEVDEVTGWKKIYTWHENEEHAAGWWDEYGENKWDDTISFDAGQGFLVQGDGYTLQSSGEVSKAPVASSTPDIGLCGIGNPYPIAISLADMSGGGYEEGEEAWGEVIVKVLGTDGAAEVDETTGWKKIYTWHENEEHAAGWWDEYGENKWDDTISFDAGQGFLVQGDGYTLEFTAPAAMGE